MKLPWDSRYLKIAFHVIVTLVVVYALVLLMNGLVFILVRPTAALSGVFEAIGKFLGLFTPVFIGFILAYILNPMADFFQRLGKRIFKKRANEQEGSEKRIFGTVAAYAVVLLFILGVLLLLVFRGGGKISTMFSREMASTIAATMGNMGDSLTRMEIRLTEWGVGDYFSGFITRCITGVQTWLSAFGNRLFARLSSTGSSLVDFALGTVIGFYFLIHKHTIKSKALQGVRLWFSSKNSSRILWFMGQINQICSGYIQGQLTDALIIGTLITAWLLVMRVDFAVLIGIVSGCFNVIPYVGAVAGLLLTLIAATLGGGGLVRVLIVAIGIVVIQQLDALVLQPKIVGENVQMNPVLVIISLTVAGKLFGFAGLLFAVPLCAIVKMFIEILWAAKVKAAK